jgi:hypothetical protein
VRARDLNQVVADALPLSDAQVVALDLTQAETALMEEITAASHAGEDLQLGPSAQPSTRSRAGWRRPLAVGMACLGIAAAFVIVGLDSGGDGGDDVAFGRDAIRIAEANPRLLATYPGWSVTRADLAPGIGEMTFSDGEHDLDLTYSPAKGGYDEHYEELGAGDPSPEFIELLGERATVFQYGGEYLTITPPLARYGDLFIEIRGDVGSEDRYLDVVESMESTEVTTWLSAMPESSVARAQRGPAINEMLKGIPLRSGFDVGALEQDPALRGQVRDRHQVAAVVTGAVTCTWLDRWYQAKLDGDGPREREARQALDTAHDWPILQQLDHGQSAWPEHIWDLAEDGRSGSSYGWDTDPRYWRGGHCKGRPAAMPALERAWREVRRRVPPAIDRVERMTSSLRWAARRVATRRAARQVAERAVRRAVEQAAR